VLDDEKEVRNDLWQSQALAIPQSTLGYIPTTLPTYTAGAEARDSLHGGVILDEFVRGRVSVRMSALLLSNAKNGTPKLISTTWEDGWVKRRRTFSHTLSHSQRVHTAASVATSLTRTDVVAGVGKTLTRSAYQEFETTRLKTMGL